MDKFVCVLYFIKELHSLEGTQGRIEFAFSTVHKH